MELSIPVKAAILLFSITMVLLTFKLLKKSTGSSSVKRINFITFLYYRDFICYSLIGTIIILFGWAKDYYRMGIIPIGKIQIYAWLSVLYAMALSALTIYFLTKVFGINIKKRFDDYINSEIQVSNGKIAYFLLWIMVILILGFNFTQFYKQGFIPIIEMFRFSELEIQAIRFNSKFNYTNSYIIRNLIVFFLPYIASYVTYIYLTKEKKLKWKVLFVAALISSVLSLTSNYEKSRLIYYLFNFLIIDLYTNKSKKKIQIKLIGITAIILSYTAAIFKQNGVDYFISINGPLGRVFLGQIVGLYLHYSLYPGTIPFMNFKYFPSFVAEIFNNETIRSARLVMKSVSKDQYAGNMNTLFLGEAYANGGILAVLLSPLVYGCFLFILYNFLIKKKKSPVWLATYSYLMFDIPTTGGFLDFFYYPSLFITIALAYVLETIINYDKA